MGTIEKYTSLGEKHIIVPYPRTEEVEDPTTPETSKSGIIGIGTRGAMEIYEFVLLKHVPEEDRAKYKTHLDEYYRSRLWHETGLTKVPIEVGKEDFAIQQAPIKRAQIYDK